MPIDEDFRRMGAIRRGEVANAAGRFECGEPGCAFVAFTELDSILHRKRGAHGQMSFMDSFRRVRGNYSGARPKEQAYSRQSRLQLQGQDINRDVPPDKIEPQ